MSDLEKTPSIEEGALKTAEDTTAVSIEIPSETSVTEQVSEAVNENEIEMEEETSEDSSRSWHEMSKEELLDTMREIVESGNASRHRDVAAIKQAFHALRTKELDRQMSDFLDAGNAPEAFSAVVDESEYQFKEYLNRFKETRAKFLAEEEIRLQENLKAKRSIIDSLKNIAEDIDNINIHYPRFKELQAEFKAIKDVTPSEDANVWKEFQAVVELFYDRLKMNKELRDLDFKKNLEIKREFIEKAKVLTEEKDVVHAFRQLQDLHQLWRETGPVAKEFRDTIWNEFMEVSTTINKRHQQFFEARKQAERENEEAKTALCAEIEGIDTSTLDSFSKWDEATKQVLDIQARWKTIGFGSKRINAQLYARYRELCDKFFAAKADYYKRVKEELAANLERKIALCEKIEAIMASDDRSKALDKVLALQNEWRTIGGVARRQSDAVWQRFSSAVNKFFEERKQKNSAQRKDENDNLAAKREVIEEIKKIDIATTPRNEAIAKIRELQAKWQSIGHVPYKLKDKIFTEYRAECDRVYNGYEAAGRRNRRADFENRINEMAAGDSKLTQERERLYRAYEQKRGELKTFENNLGFFNVKSKDGNSMVREMEKRIERIKADLDDIKKKIEVIDDKMEG